MYFLLWGEPGAAHMFWSGRLRLVFAGEIRAFSNNQFFRKFASQSRLKAVYCFAEHFQNGTGSGTFG